jgi:DNA-binding IclR family transcriptional regulator
MMNNWQSIPNIRDNHSGKGKESYTNNSLIRAANILHCLSSDINTNTEIAKCCKYSTSTVHRLLNVLKNLNWVVQDPVNHKYYLGPVINQLTADQNNAHRLLLLNSLQEMGHLSNFSGETINLSIMIQLRSILLHAIQSQQELRITEANSVYGTFFAVGATSKALLSQLDDEELKEVLHKVDLVKVTGNKITDRNMLLAQLRDIRRRQYAVSHSERITGAMCISAPIKQYPYPVALSILGPESRLKPRAREIIEELTASAGRISSSIGRAFKA